MDIEALQFCIVMSIFLVFNLNIAYFIEVDVITDFLIKLITSKKPENSEINKKIRKDKRYKKHKRKWFLIFTIHYVVLLSVLIIVTFITKEIVIGFLSGMFSFLFSYGKFGEKEEKEKRMLIKEIKKEQQSHLAEYN